MSSDAQDDLALLRAVHDAWDGRLRLVHVTIADEDGDGYPSFDVDRWVIDVRVPLSDDEAEAGSYSSVVTGTDPNGGPFVSLLAGIAARRATSTIAVGRMLDDERGRAGDALPELPTTHSAFDLRFVRDFAVEESEAVPLDLPESPQTLLEADLAVPAAIARRAVVAREALDAGADAADLAAECGITVAEVREWASTAIVMLEQ